MMKAKKMKEVITEITQENVLRWGNNPNIDNKIIQ
jgi:hypothetical protein